MLRVSAWLLIALALAAPSEAARLALPVASPGVAPLVLPAYRGDCFELQLGPRAAALARAARRAVAPAVAGTAFATLGIASIDAVAASLGGVTFEPEFRAERPPQPNEHRTDFTAFYVVTLAPGVRLEQALDAFGVLADVATVAPLAIVPVSAVTPNDSLFAQSWWYFDAASRHDIHAPEAWSVSTGDSAVLIAIMDTGVLSAHPDLGGTVPNSSGQIFTNDAEQHGFDFLDDDDNGYIDDVHGWDFVALSGAGEANPGEDWQNEDNDPNDFAGHGTAVAGLAAAMTDNTIGVAGATWHARLLPLRVGYSAPGASLGAIEMRFVIPAMLYAARMHSDIINCSFETQPTPGFTAAVDAAIQGGALVVNAAGNLTPDTELARREDVLAVAATDQNDVVDINSNRGDYVDLSAPGVGLSSTFVFTAPGDSISSRSPGYVFGINGTSFAAPLVSGAAALVIADRRARGERPLSPMGMILRLRESADDISAQNPGDSGYGDGRLNAYRALTEPRVSLATRAGAATIGAPVVLQTTGRSRIVVYATADSALLYVSTLGDTLRRVPLGAGVVGSPAAADMGDGRGTGVFVALDNAYVAGFDGYGNVRSGWPQPLNSSTDLPGFGPSLGDIDGDGTVEVTCVTVLGNVWVWSSGGAIRSPFPFTAGSAPPIGPAALADLDGVPGAEIVVGNALGRIYVYRHDGSALPNWPRVTGAGLRAPIIARLGHAPGPCVVYAAGVALRALTAAGTVVMNGTLGGTAAGDPVAADVDGDGADEFIVPLTAPDAIAVVDSAGMALSGWPVMLAAPAAGAAVARAAATDPTASLVLLASDRLRGYDRTGVAVPQEPKPGLPGPVLTWFDLGPDLGERVMPSAGADDYLYFYMPPRAYLETNAASGWLTDRANFARTGGRLYEPAGGAVNTRPAAVADLAVAAAHDSSVSLAWTATGGDSVFGRPEAYEVRAADLPIHTEADFAAAPLVRTVPATMLAGAAEHAEFTGLVAGHTYWFALRARDAQGEMSAVSNTVSAKTTGGGGPLAGVTGLAVVSMAQPTRTPVTFVWQGNAGAAQTLAVFDITGRLRRTFDLGPGASGQLQWDGRDRGGALVESGVYFLRITSGGAHAGSRLVIVR